MGSVCPTNGRRRELLQNQSLFLRLFYDSSGSKITIIYFFYICLLYLLNDVYKLLFKSFFFFFKYIFLASLEEKVFYAQVAYIIQ